jgi:hypothetical protein
MPQLFFDEASAMNKIVAEVAFFLLAAAVIVPTPTCSGRN